MILLDVAHGAIHVVLLVHYLEPDVVVGELLWVGGHALEVHVVNLELLVVLTHCFVGFV